MTARHYRQNHLTTVILRLDFEQIPALTSIERTPFSERVRELFPHVNGIQLSTVVLNVNPSAETGINQQVTGMQWEHRKHQDGAQVIFLSPTHMSLEYRNGEYDHFPAFRAEFECGLQALTQTYPDIKVVRIGLRYVNQVRFADGNPLDWTDIIADQLIQSVFSGIRDGASLVRSMHQLQTKRNSIDTLFNYGIHNPEYPAPVSRREFVIDIDSYRSEAIALNEVVNQIAALNLKFPADAARFHPILL